MRKVPGTIDGLFELARRDPEALERYRQQEIRRIIEAAPPYLRRRLTGLQFTIDMEREKYSDPLAACVEISRMMQQSFDELRDLLNSLPSMEEPPARPQQKTADILPFPPQNPDSK